MSEHTPGPWIFGNTSNDKHLILGGPREKYVASVTIHQIPRHMGLYDEPEREANARLIAAAPDLLKTLQTLLEMTTKRDDMHGFAAVVRQALAKAEGEQDHAQKKAI